MADRKIHTLVVQFGLVFISFLASRYLEVAGFLYCTLVIMSALLHLMVCDTSVQSERIVRSLLSKINFEEQRVIMATHEIEEIQNNINEVILI
ncbi:hypothetical protein ACXM0N_23380 [Peribacillus simplex]